MSNQTKAAEASSIDKKFGLDTNRGKLAATCVIKRPTGSSGDHGHYGSDEHVAFWANG